MNSNFNKLRSRTGGYSLPFLIKLSDLAETTNLYYINDTVDLVYLGNTYTAVAFDYVPAAGKSGYGGGGNLSLPALPEIIAMLETNDNLKLVSIGVLLDGGGVAPAKQFTHTYCRASWGGRRVTLTFEKDDKATMTFPGLVFSHYNVRGL